MCWSVAPENVKMPFEVICWENILIPIGTLYTVCVYIFLVSFDNCVNAYGKYVGKTAYVNTVTVLLFKVS